MISLSQFSDYEYMDSLIREPSMFQCVSDDACNNPDKFTVKKLAIGNSVFLKAAIDGVECGFFAFVDRGQGVFEQHTILLPNCRGKNAIEAGANALELCKQVVYVNQYESYCYSDMKASIWYAKKLGYTQGGIISSTTRNGTPVDIISLSRNP